MSRPRACPDETLLRIVLLRRQGWTYERISRALNAAAVPTACGGRTWHKSYVWRMLDNRDGRRLRDADDPEAELASWSGD